MTDKIEIGEYIRTNEGYIAKFKKYLENTGTYMFDNVIQDIDGDKYKCISENELKKVMIKHSKNIIDLIEIGDYVNGYRILAMEDSIYENSKRVLIYKNQKERYERWIYIQEHDRKIHNQDDIVEILTKEMYEQNLFKVVE